MSLAGTRRVPDVYLTLHELPDGSGVSVGIPRDEALTMDRDAFADLYRKTVWGSKKREAYAWADTQIAEREQYLGGQVL